MRILFVNEYCGYLGGVEQNVAHVARGLRMRGHHCSLLYSRASLKGAEGYRQIFDLTAQAPLEQLVPHVNSLAETFRADVIYLHRIPDLEPFLDWPGRVRCVRMVHDHDLACPRRHKYYFWNQRICQHPAGWRCVADLAFLEKAPGGGLHFRSLSSFFRQLKLHQQIGSIIVGSQFMLTELLQNGIPCDRLRILAPVVPVPLRPMEPPSIDPNVLFVGQLVHGKGVDLLLQALHRLDCPFRLEVVGDGNARQSLELLACKLGLNNSVNFSGFLMPDELSQAFRNCRVVAVPSRWAEPFGMIGLEAASYGRPVVGFACGGIPDWLEHGRTGFLSAERDVDGLAKALRILLTDRDKATEMGREAYERTSPRFDFQEYLQCLEHCLVGRR